MRTHSRRFRKLKKLHPGFSLHALRHSLRVSTCTGFPIKSPEYSLLFLKQFSPRVRNTYYKTHHSFVPMIHLRDELMQNLFGSLPTPLFDRARDVTEEWATSTLKYIVYNINDILWCQNRNKITNMEIDTCTPL